MHNARCVRRKPQQACTVPGCALGARTRVAKRARTIQPHNETTEERSPGDAGMKREIKKNNDQVIHNESEIG